jgi:anthranilate phosphoribosyltransferase
LPFRTLFNLVGPLANPARPDYQLVGVAGSRQACLVAEAMARLGARRVAVVTGADGLDEVSLAGPTQVRLVENGAVATLEWTPADFGLGTVEAADLRVSGPSDSAARISHLLASEPGPVRAMVLANAAAALWVAGRCQGDLQEGVRLAEAAIDSGHAAALLDRWRTLSREHA